MKRIILLLTLLLASTQLMNAQYNYNADYRTIQQLISQGAYNQAYPKAEKVFAQAQKEHNSHEMLHATYVLNQTAQLYQENASDSALLRYLRLLPVLAPADQSLCHLLVAKVYHSYWQQNRWRIEQNEEVNYDGDTLDNNLTQVEVNGVDDYKMWSKRRFEKTIERHCAEAMKEASSLKVTPVRYAQYCCDTSSPKNLLTTPTLYDLVLHEVIGMATKEATQLALWRDLLSFHQQDKEDDLRIWIELRMVDLDDDDNARTQHNEADNNDKINGKLLQLIKKYKDSKSDWVTSIYHEMATRLRTQNRMVEAVAYCDTAIGRAPKSMGGVACYNLREELLKPQLWTEVEQDRQMPHHSSLAVVTHTNADHLYCRIVKHSNNNDRDHLKRKVIEQWDQALPHYEDLLPHKSYVYVPPLPSGNYDLLVSVTKDFKQEGYTAQQLSLCEAQLLSTSDDGLEGLLVNRQSGKPFAHHKVEIVNTRNNKTQVLASTTTDTDGRYHFDNNIPGIENWGNEVRVVIDGVTLTESCRKNYPETEIPTSLCCFLDRPIYRPGDTLHFSVLCYKSDGHKVAATLANIPLTCILLSPQNKPIDTVELTSDALGTASGSFILPDDAMPGNYRLRTSSPANGRQTTHFSYFTVEHYKQPKFLVTMPQEKATHHFGEAVHQSLTATTYSGAPVGGAKVSWQVQRAVLHPWRWWANSYEREVIANGEGTTLTDGSFTIDFVPEPAPGAEKQTAFSFTITADVTDVNGETHSQSATLHIGRVNSQLVLSGEEKVESLGKLEMQYLNLDGEPLDGKIHVTLEQVELPDRAQLRHPLMSNEVFHSLSRSDFEKQFPLMAYQPGDLDPTQWKRSLVTSYDINILSNQARRLLDLPEQRNVGAKRVPLEGLFRVSLYTIDKFGDTIRAEQYYSVQPREAKSVVGQQLLESHIDRSRAEVGEKVTLQMGSRFQGVEVYCLVSAPDTTFAFQHRTIDNELQQWKIDVDEAMLGGFDITLLAVKENVEVRKSYHIEVPYSHKQLKVEWASFRDKLLPGESETWTVKITPPQGEDLRSTNLLMTMYDAALESYQKLQWGLFPWRMKGAQSRMVWRGIYAYCNYRMREPKVINYQGPLAEGWGLSGIYSFAEGGTRNYGRMMNKSARAKMMPAMEECAAANGAVMGMARGEASEEEFCMADNVVQTTAVKEAQMETKSMADNEADNHVDLRENLGTLGFWMPTLRTKEDATVTFSFTAPESLTQWNIQGLAWNSELQVGSLSSQMVTRKPLMVVPGVPRFLREGDAVSFVSKVINMTDTGMDVNVRLEMRSMDKEGLNPQEVDGKGCDTFFADCQHIHIEGNESKAVKFTFMVPQGIHSALYRVTVSSAASQNGEQEFSDGEQAPIAVLSNRELVTESVSMYLNGAGEKHYRLAHLLESGNSPTLQHESALVEFSANPIWYAVQSIPYIADREDPSNIYRANALYANSIGQFLVGQYPQIEQVLSSDSATTETVAHYFDRKELQDQLDKNRTKLLQAQRSDGAWSWIPGGNYPSQYITQYILKMNGRQERLTGKQMLAEKNRTQALYYVDRENYDFYQKWVKKQKECNATNIDYLYARSFYPQTPFMGKTKDAYNYYYNNALKHRGELRSLYSQAQLALIFERHGDHKAATEMALRIKGRALYSDEMGMYWRDNVSGLGCYDRPIEVQGLLIEVMDEVLDDSVSVGLMQQWLLKQKQTTRWNSDVATANAVSALLTGCNHKNINASKLKTNGNDVEIYVGGNKADNQLTETPLRKAIGYQQHQWTGEDVESAMGDISIKKSSPGMGWGAFFWQYYEELDKIPYSEMGIKMQKQLFKVEADGTVTPFTEGAVGDKVRVRILIDCDRNMEYLELKDGRAGCMEPVSTASGWHYSWRDGLGYYLVVEDDAHTLFIDRLEKGKYVMEYDVWITHEGSFTSGTTSMYCHYAPEFRSTIGGKKLVIK